MMWLGLAAVSVLGCGRHGFEPASNGDAPGEVRRDAAADAEPDASGSTGPDGSMPIDAAVSGILTATFTNTGATGAPGTRRSTGAAVESTATVDRVWIFGGFAGVAGTKNDLLSLDTGSNAWTTVIAGGVPSIRERHALAWDPIGDAVVVFGGSYTMIVNPTFYDALYVYRPATNAWTLIPKVGNWPAARRDTALVWIPTLGKFLLYGGANGTGTGNRFGDLWLLTLNAVAGTGSWAQLAPGGVTPPAQSAACIAYDAGARRIFLFGGETQDGNSAGTTYQYLVDTNTWQADSTTGPTPPGESFTQCAWDPVAARLVVYGGQLSGGGPTGGAYAYDPVAKQWAAMPVMGADPGPRADGGAVYSPALGRLVWFGGRTGNTAYTNETWSLDLTLQ